ncbi:restriction endonuclease subunit S [Streptococcus pluranimalium]|uniref:restriction endonuclease subunit S n=1 Tax=Streptococcus hyovaginalis TaxID=149015 RepID=UPI002A9138F8|nr:restriction endonuclease subunit S [Streptococcus hyovaginalis]MDY5974680.1 restriction endonuclease subunit S [Streptococcus hyovaginalis]
MSIFGNEPEPNNTRKLKELTTIFKGRAVSSKAEGDRIAVINIVDIKSGEIDYSNLKTYDEDDRSVSRYLLEKGDLLIASKGTQIKVAVFDADMGPVVASSNITIVRPKEKVRGYYLKFFFESDVGYHYLEATNHGKAVINLSTKEIKEIPIPIIPLVKQDYAIGRYLKGLLDYKRKTMRAHQEWQHIQDDVRRSLF